MIAQAAETAHVAATVIGYGVMGIVASIAVGGALLVIWWVIGLVGNEVFARLRRVYNLAVIRYWLDRLEKGGMREFQKAEQYDQALKASGVVPQRGDAP